MKKYTIFYNRCFVFRWGGIGVLAILLVACSSPTKYPLRAPVDVSIGLDALNQGVTQTMNSNLKTGASVSRSDCGYRYQVKAGDSLSKIAYQCQVSMMQLAQLNHLSPPYKIYVNQLLDIPQNDIQPYRAAEMVFAQNQASLSQVESKKESVLLELIDKENSKKNNWLWPIHKTLSYRLVRDEKGVSVLEIYGIPGQRIQAVASGSVVYSGEGIIEFGKMLVIKHDDGYMSVYAHNSDLLVQEGDRVQVGQQIALLGATGNAERPKLYLEARFKGRKVDILNVLALPGFKQ